MDVMPSKDLAYKFSRHKLIEYLISESNTKSLIKLLESGDKLITGDIAYYGFKGNQSQNIQNSVLGFVHLEHGLMKSAKVNTDSTNGNYGCFIDTPNIPMKEMAWVEVWGYESLSQLGTIDGVVYATVRARKAEGGNSYLDGLCGRPTEQAIQLNKLDYLVMDINPSPDPLASKGIMGITRGREHILSAFFGKKEHGLISNIRKLSHYRIDTCRLWLENPYCIKNKLGEKLHDHAIVRGCEVSIGKGYPKILNIKLNVKNLDYYCNDVVSGVNS